MDSEPTIDELKRRLANAEAQNSALRESDRRVEAGLRESETRHHLLVESWTQAVWETDAAGFVVSDSPSWRAYTGQKLDEWLGYGWLDAIHPDDRAYAETQWREAIAARRVVDAEFRLRAPDGGWRWTNVRAAPVFDTEGRIEKWAGVNIDVDARKKSEEALRKSEEKYRVLFDSIDEGLTVVELVRDSEGRPIDLIYREFNQAFERLSGLPSTVMDKGVREVLPQFNPDWFVQYARITETGVPERSEEYLPDLGIWNRRFMSRIGGPGSPFVAVVFDDITERKRAEITLRESEERQAFLLKLSDAVRPLADPADIQGQTTRLLREQLNAGWCYYVDWDLNRQIGLVLRDSVRAGLPSLTGAHDVSDAPEFLELLSDSTVRAVRDYANYEQLPGRIRHNFVALGFRSMMMAPLFEEGRLTATLLVGDTEVRDWSASEASFLAEAAERTWAAIQRGRAEAALRESEARFQQFANASSAGMWIRDATTLAMEYVSPAIATIYGVAPDAFLGDMKIWAGTILPDDRDIALKHIAEARKGKAVVHEFRIQRPNDGTFRWIRNTDFPLFDVQGRVQRIGGLAEDVTEAKLAVEHQDVLLAELQHRVRNIMGMIRSMANRTAAGAIEVIDYRSLLEGRLLALARVQALLTRGANVGGSLRSVLESEIAAQAHHGSQFELTGPDVTLSPKAVEVLTLAFHELATNALKYGALSVPDGRLKVDWIPIEKRGAPWLALDWIERGAPPREPSNRRGFGSELIEGRIPYELKGSGKISVDPEGARCHLEFPLREGESILETDAPQPTTVFGGSIDMTGAPDLNGKTVLVVEDDFYMATDATAALRAAGAEVLGPCSDELTTRDLLASETPTHAVLDLNLGGGGPRFEIAHLLKSRGAPFIFLTGYDPDVIPDDFTNILRLQKPVEFRAIVEAISKL